MRLWRPFRRGASCRTNFVALIDFEKQGSDLLAWVGEGCICSEERGVVSVFVLWVLVRKKLFLYPLRFSTWVCKLNWQDPPRPAKLNGRAIVVREKTALITYIWEFTEKCDSKGQLEFEAYMLS